jgi:hypothetical protein
MANDCNQICPTERGVHIHFSRKHNFEDTLQWRAPLRKIWIRTQMPEENREHSSKISSQENNSTTENQPKMRVRRFPHEEGILRSLSQQENQREIERSQELDEELTLQDSKKTISRKENLSSI